MELVNQQIFCYVSSNSSLCTRKFSLRELAQMSFVLMSQHGNHGKVFVEACKNAGFTPNIVAQVNDSACFRKMISSGIAIGVTGKFGAAVEGNTTLVPMNITDFKHEQTICMYYKKENNRGNTAKFIFFLRENIKKGIYNDSL